MTDDTPSGPPVFHEGEIAVQTRAGVAELAAKFGPQFIRRFMQDQHRVFFQSLPFMLVGALDRDGRPWASAVFGNPGFITSPDAQTLVIGGAPLLEEQLALQLGNGAKLGLLGIELPTRRRNRMNGTVAARNGQGLIVQVDQSYGNCPQYIQRHELAWRNGGEPLAGRAMVANTTDKALARHIGGAHTFYIASRSAAMDGGATSGVDVSHRGGKPGFVRVGDDGVLSFPDFSGNRMFNTLGNISIDDRVGMFFPDLVTGHAVFVSGRASIDWDGPRIAEFTGAQRIIDVVPERVVYGLDVLPIAGEFVDAWPMLAETGDWPGTPER